MKKPPAISTLISPLFVAIVLCCNGPVRAENPKCVAPITFRPKNGPENVTRTSTFISKNAAISVQKSTNYMLSLDRVSFDLRYVHPDGKQLNLYEHEFLIKKFKDNIVFIAILITFELSDRIKPIEIMAENPKLYDQNKQYFYRLKSEATFEDCVEKALYDDLDRVPSSDVGTVVFSEELYVDSNLRPLLTAIIVYDENDRAKHCPLSTEVLQRLQTNIKIFTPSTMSSIAVYYYQSNKDTIVFPKTYYVSVFISINVLLTKFRRSLGFKYFWLSVQKEVPDDICYPFAEDELGACTVDNYFLLIVLPLDKLREFRSEIIHSIDPIITPVALSSLPRTAYDPTEMILHISRNTEQPYVTSDFVNVANDPQKLRTKNLHLIRSNSGSPIFVTNSTHAQPQLLGLIDHISKDSEFSTEDVSAHPALNKLVSATDPTDSEWSSVRDTLQRFEDEGHKFTAEDSSSFEAIVRLFTDLKLHVIGDRNRNVFMKNIRKMITICDRIATELRQDAQPYDRFHADLKDVRVALQNYLAI